MKLCCYAEAASYSEGLPKRTMTLPVSVCDRHPLRPWISTTSVSMERKQQEKAKQLQALIYRFYEGIIPSVFNEGTFVVCHDPVVIKGGHARTPFLFFRTNNRMSAETHHQPRYAYKVLVLVLYSTCVQLV
jgi:hypothetical protein